MYLWRIELLKNQLRQGPLGQRAAFTYVWATLLFYTIATAAPGLWNATSESATTADWVAFAIMVLLVGGGTYAAYRTNGGQAGSDFAARFFALGWVLFIRLLVLLLAPALFAAWAAIAVVEVEGERLNIVFGWAGAALGVVFGTVYYWRLVHHFGQIATFDSAREDNGREAG